MFNQIIPVFVINLKTRTDRKLHVEKEFAGRNEFSVTIVEACEHKVGAIGLWNSIRNIIQNLVNVSDEFIILCEDDHQFTEDYNIDVLISCIKEAQKQNADIFLGGVSWMNSMLNVSKNIYWVEKFSGLQFTIVFRKFYDRILEAEFLPGDAADHKISDLSQKKYFVYPFISVQKGFNYSDVTPKNNMEGRVTELFEKTGERAKLMKKVTEFYNTNMGYTEGLDDETINSISIPTYMISTSKSSERRLHIEEQFASRKEFDLIKVDISDHDLPNVSLWLSIRKVINIAKENNDDVIVICLDTHSFTPDYNKELFLTNVIEAHRNGIDYMSGGSGDFGFAIPITKNRFWISECLSPQFIVVYHSFFQKILDEPYGIDLKADELLSEITANKMLLFPFISNRMKFASDSENTGSNSVNRSEDAFEISSRRLKILQDAYLTYQT